MSELQGLQLSIDEIHRRGCVLATVVVDPVETNATLARDAGLSFPILSDATRATLDAYDLRHDGAGPDGSDIAHPASVLVDADGVVRWTYVSDNLRVRATPDRVLAAIGAVVHP